MDMTVPQLVAGLDKLIDASFKRIALCGEQRDFATSITEMERLRELQIARGWVNEVWDCFGQE